MMGIRRNPTKNMIVAMIDMKTGQMKLNVKEGNKMSLKLLSCRTPLSFF
jgi:hypothetical protein